MLRNRSSPQRPRMRVRMMRQVLMQAITNERAHGDVDLNLTHQLAVAGEQTGEHQPYRYLGIDAGPRSSSQSQSETSSQPRQVEHAVDAYQHVVIRNELSDPVMKSLGSCRSLRPSISRPRQHRIIDENGISYRGTFPPTPSRVHRAI